MKLILTVCLISIGYASAQYQDNYESNNVNPYPRSQYDSNEAYSPPTRSQSYPPSRSSPTVYSKLKNVQPKVVAKLTPEEEEAAAEEEKKPSELELLLANSKFSCGSLKDGYYADDSLNCQVFHYCVGGAKHSWMCPKGTVFHQVHLNCVPAAQDICSQSEKYHIVNEYLHKPIEQSLGGNQTVRYHQRYYPDEFINIDPSIPPNTGAQYPPASRPSNSYNSNSYNSYEEETPVSYRQPARSSNKPSYPSIPKPVISTKPKSSYSSSGNYPVSLISSPQPSRKPSSPSVYNGNNYDDGTSFRSAPPIYTQQTPAVRSQPHYQSNKPAYKQGTNYQPYSASASAPAYKPSSLNSIKPTYSNYPNAARPSAGYEPSNNNNNNNNNSNNNNNNNGKPYNDYSGVTYEEDY